MRSLLLVWLVAGCGEVAKLQSDGKVAMCGDSVVDPGEACDTGAESATCNDDCTVVRCGDMKVNAAAGEQCEDGDTDNTNACTNTCRRSVPFASTGAEGAFAPEADVVLSSGTHHFTTINIPSGVKVTTDGTGVLELLATGAVTIAGTIDMSGGAGGDGGVNTANQNCDTGGGGGGTTGFPIAGASGASNSLVCPVGGVGGLGSPGTNGVGRGSPCAGGAPGAFGGGAGAGACVGGGGGGGFAGGGGGAGYNVSHGGAGASAFGGVGGAAGVANANQDGSGKVSGRGGQGLGRYAGRDGSFSTGCTTSVYPATNGGGGGIGALAQSDLAVTTTFQPGSGGGGGGGQCNYCYNGGGGGGGGGGALRIASAESITVAPTGVLRANGGDGGRGSPGGTGQTQASGGGGGGSGGVIYIAAPNVDVQLGATVSVTGGFGGSNTVATCGKGGDGGIGRIRISAVQTTCKLDGSFTPALNAAGCAPSSVPEKVYVAPYPN